MDKQMSFYLVSFRVVLGFEPFQAQCT